MVDTSGWDGLPDVKIDDAAATSLATGCTNAAKLIRDQVSGRKTLTTDALQDFKGSFSVLFAQNQSTANSDGEEIATALDNIAKAVTYIQGIVPAENKRRQDARAWAERRKKDKSEITLSDLGGDEDPPEGPTSPPPPTMESAKSTSRETPQPGTGGGGGGGTSSARPQELRNFVTGVSGKITAMEGKSSSLEGLNNDFTAGFDWGTGEKSGVDGSSVYSALKQYHQLNQQDKTWVTTIAQAFEKAGGSGDMVTLSDAALANSLKEAGVQQSRLDIKVKQAEMYGISPTTGYSDDPVNAHTGNFVEPESDLSFPGGCASLELTRMYNSFDRAGGAFGPGWSSWTEVRLVLESESASFVRPDGREVVFPRLGAGWDRAANEPAWLERDEAADELRVTDNDGETWRFDAAGRVLSRDRGAGTMVGFVHSEGRLVRLEHERGRHIELTWDGDRVVAATTGDGQAVAYRYDDQQRLIAADGESGERTYRWGESGLIEAVVDADGVVEVENTYDEQGRVTRQRSPHGRISRYTYLPGNVTEVADLDGTRANTWIHDARGRLIGLVDSDGNRQSTSYDQHGNPVLVTAVDGSVIVREFDERSRIVREVLPSGADVSFEYDDADRVVRVVPQEGSEVRYAYDGGSRNPSMILDPEGGETRLEWSSCLLTRVIDPTGVELHFGYDEFGDLVSMTNAVGDTARLEHDDAGRVTAAITPRGNRTTYTHSPAGLTSRRDPDGALWRYERTAAGRLVAIVDPTGARSSVEYAEDGEPSRQIDPLGRAVSERRDDLGNLAALTLPDGSTWRFTHDALSRLTSTTTPDGHTWRQEYDAGGDDIVVSDPLGNRTHVAARNGSNGSSLVTRDDAGIATERFDPLGRLVRADDVAGSSAMAVYDRCGRPVELLDEEGALTKIERDPAGRPVAVTDPTGRVTRYEYDACGRRTVIVDPGGARTTIQYNADSLPVRCIHPTGEVGWIDYDECMRVTASFTPGVGSTRVRYDEAGRVVEIRDSASGLRRFSYDAAGQLVSATNGNGGVTRFEYDVRGRAVRLVDPLGHATMREFDEMDRCVAETDPLGRTTTAGYDPLGRQLWQQDPAGRRIEWRYDAVGRLIEILADGESIGSWAWDVRGRQVDITDHTRPDGKTVMHRRSFNRRGQLMLQTRGDQRMAWTYDAAGRRTSLTLPSADRIDYRYDAAGRIATVDHPLLGRATFEHDESGRLVTAMAGELSQSWTWTDGFVTGHTTVDAAGSARTTVERDESGRVHAIEQDGTRQTFEYDAAHQLVRQVFDGLPTTWRYDLSGRIVTETTTNDRHEFVHDAAGQLVSVTGSDGVTAHEYDAVGRRTATTRPDGGTTELSWTTTGWLSSIVHALDDDSWRTELHVDATGELAGIDGAAVFWDSAESYAPGLVQVGSTPVVAAGALTGVGGQWLAAGWRAERGLGTDAWSTAAGPVDISVPGMPEGLGITTSGDLTVGHLEWLRARVYDPSARGFLSVDPLDPVIGAGWAGNPYSYAGNDPLHAVDPTGLKPVSAADLAAANEPSWLEKTGSFIAKHKDWIIGGVAVVGGGLLMATGVGGPAGAMLMSFGADVLIQKATTGEVNYKQAAVSGLAGGAGFVASKGLTIGGKAVVMSAKAKNWSTATKAVWQGGVGMAEGYSYQVAGGAEPLSKQAVFGGLAGGATGGFGQHADDLGKTAGNAVQSRMLKGVEEQMWGTRWVTKGAAWVGGHSTDHLVRGTYKGTLDASGEFVKQVTDDTPGVDYGKVGGKAVGSGLAKPLPTGWSSPVGRGLSAAADGAMS